DVGGAAADAAASVRPGDQVARCDQDLPDAADARSACGAGREAQTGDIVRRVDAKGRRRAAQVVRAAPRASAVAALAAALAVAVPARAQVARDSAAPAHELFATCAGDGLPPNPFAHAGRAVPYSVQLSAL